MADCNSCNKTKADVPYIVYESAMARNERTVKRLVAVIVVLSLVLCATIGGFLWYLSQYDFSGEEIIVDAYDGHANYIGENGDINNGSYNSQETDSNAEEPFPLEGNSNPQG